MLIVKKIKRSAPLYEKIEGVESNQTLFPDRTIRMLKQSCVCSKTRALGLACLGCCGSLDGREVVNRGVTSSPLIQCF